MDSFFSKEETLGPAFTTKATPLISYGLRFPDACAKHVRETFNASNVYIIASRSLSQQTDALKKLVGALGNKVRGVRTGISPHTPILECLEVIQEVKSLDIDCFVTLGAGSLTDAAKIVRFALANNAFTPNEVRSLWGGHSFNPERRAVLLKPTIPLIHIPTSLSGGEYQSIAGGTDPVTHAKRTYEPLVDPELVIQDPELCLTTPERIWISTGVRSIDHCIETLCSLQSHGEGDRQARKGLIDLITGLMASKKSKDLLAMHTCQSGVVAAMAAVSSGIPLGASHAIGHQLGPLGVGHGETSCICLPAVCDYNLQNMTPAGVYRQRQVTRLLCQQTAVLQLLLKNRRDPDSVELGEILRLIIAELGMPNSLKDVGIHKDQFDQLAENTLHDIWIKTNAVPITDKQEVLKILHAVSGNQALPRSEAPKTSL